MISLIVIYVRLISIDTILHKKLYFRLFAGQRIVFVCDADDLKCVSVQGFMAHMFLET